MSEVTHRAALAPGYRIQWYEIQRILGQGGFGITYLARDTNLDQLVAIKEYLPVELAVRDDDRTVHPMSGKHGEQYQWGLERFLDEARTLARFKHPNIVRVLSVFEANNTAYMVMEYERGDSLQARLSNRATLDETVLLQIVLPLLGGLEQVHAAGFIHRDIKPDNIFLREDGSPVLLDFGSARQATGQQTKTLTSLVSPGYAPFEQYYSKSDEQGPWTDIYGLAATMYRAICGRPPTDAVDRSRTILESSKDYLVSAREIGSGTYSERLLTAIDHGLAFRATERPRDIATWKEDFDIEAHVQTRKRIEAIEEAPTVRAERATPNAPQPVDARTAQPVPPAPTSPGASGNGARSRFGAMLGAIAAVAGAVFLAVNHWPARDPHERAPTPTPVATVTPIESVEPELAPIASTADLPVPTARAQLQPTPQPPATATASAAAGNAERIAQLLRRSQAQLDAGNTLSPPGDNALGSLREVLALDADNTDARRAVRDIYTNLLGEADRALRAGDPGAAQVSIDYAAVIDPNGQELALMRIAMRDAQRRQAVQQEQDKARQREAEREALAAAKAEAEARARDAAAAERSRLAKLRADEELKARARARAQEQEKARQIALAAERVQHEASQERERLAALQREQEITLATRQADALRQCETRKATVRPEPQRAQGDALYFAALAVGEDNSWGEASGYRDRQQAEGAALDNCREHGKNCKVQAWSNDCVAFARGAGTAAGWSWGASIAEAGRKAIDFCERHSACCSVTTAYCADEVQ